MSNLIGINKGVDNRMYSIIRDWILKQGGYNMQFYGEFNLGINFIKTDKVPTAGVNVSHRGFNFYYNEEFISKLSDTELAFLIIHENYHLLFEHQSRTKNIGADHELSNIAQDLIINKIIHEKIPHDIATMIMEGDKQAGLMLPPEYEGQELYEEVYTWILEKKDEVQKEMTRMLNNAVDNAKQNMENQQGQGNQEQDGENNGNGSGSGQGDQDQNQDGEGGDNPDDWRKKLQHDMSFKDDPYFDNPNDSEEMNNVKRAIANSDHYKFDEHLKDEVPEEIKQEMIKDKIQEMKNRGLVKGDMEEVIGRLRKKKKDYLKAIKRGISLIKGNIKNSTFARPNRRGMSNLKGRKKYAQVINCIIDTSGSMGGYFDRAFEFIFQSGIEINLVQVDTEVRDVQRITDRKQLEKVKIKGLGGTTLQPALDLIKSDSKTNKLNTLILTDGYTDTLDTSGMRKVLIISNDAECPVSNPRNVNQIVIEDFKD